MEILTNDLRLCRNAFVYFHRKKRKVNENKLQNIFVCFLQHIIDNLPESFKLRKDIKAIDANSFRLVAHLPDGVSVPGNTDVATCAVDNDKVLKQIFEVKAPYTVLGPNHSGYAAKDQIMVEVAGLASYRPSDADMLVNETSLPSAASSVVVGGALTDMFSIHVVFRVANQIGTQPPAKYYISERVILPDDYLHYVLFLLILPTSPDQLNCLWENDGVVDLYEDDVDSDNPLPSTKHSSPHDESGKGKKRRVLGQWQPTGDGKRAKPSNGGGHVQGASRAVDGRHRRNAGKECNNGQENRTHFNICINNKDEALDSSDDDPLCYSHYYNMYCEDPEKADEDYEVNRRRRVLAAQREGKVYLDRDALLRLGRAPPVL